MDIGLILVAAGYGSVRTGENKEPVSKLVEKVSGREMFLHPLIAAERAGVLQTIIVANPLYQACMKRAVDSAGCTDPFSHPPTFIIQKNRRGSGDAVLQAIPTAQELGMDHALIAYGDMPLWSAGTMRRLIAAHAQRNTVVTMVTVGRSALFPALDRYGRVMRDPQARIKRVVETNVASHDELVCTHVNPSLWIWDLSWLQENIPRVQPVKRADGQSDEIYMPPLVEMAHRQGKPIGEIRLPAERGFEALGVNTREELEMVRSVPAHPLR